MREVWVIVKVNFYGEEIDRCSKEFDSCESAERYLFNTGYFDNPYLWSIRKETRIPMEIGSHTVEKIESKIQKGKSKTGIENKNQSPKYKNEN